MNRFSRLSALWASFYSRDLYREVVAEWKGIGLVYLLLLLGLCWLPSAARWFLGVREFAAAMTQSLAGQLPAVTIRNGVMTASPAGRHVIPLRSKSSGPIEGVLVIDDSVDTVPGDITTDALVLTRREVGVVQPLRGDRRVRELPPTSNADVPPEHVETFLRSLPVWLPPVLYMGALAGSLLFRLLQSLVYGAAAMAYARRERVNLDYTSAIRLATVAVTPVVVIRTLIWFGPWEPAWYWRWPAAFLITAGYLAFGIRAAASAQPASQSA